MAVDSGGSDYHCSKNNPPPSQPLTEETTTTKRHRFTAPTQQTHQPNLTSPSLPFDIVSEILRKLPVKSLLRFRCVCKPWNALISDPQFAKEQFQASSAQLTRNHLIITFKDPSRELLRDYPLPSVFNSSSSSATRRRFPCCEYMVNLLCGSCHGMLCLAIDRFFPILWNPSTGKFEILPYVGYANRIVYGFGYDPISDSYKMVAVLGYGWIGDHGDEYKADVMVHTLGTDSWRAIQEFPGNCVDADDSGRFVSGTLNWLAKDNTSSSWVIVSLDLGTETYQKLLPPVGGGGDGVTLSLSSGVLKGCLCIIAKCNVVSDFWVMKDYGNEESWSKLFSVPYIGECPQFCPCYMGAICISEEEDEILLEVEGSLTIYNSKSGTFKDPGIKKFTGCIVADVYAESLISPC